ncbi:MAG: CARDB domain-containing protein [Phycisphaerae bacterium]|nr:CARDB domain-containing protein [Phycisphaerae bacterium]
MDGGDPRENGASRGRFASSLAIALRGPTKVSLLASSSRFYLTEEFRAHALSCPFRRASIGALAATLLFAPSALAGGGLDLAIQRVEFSQAIQTEEPSSVQVQNRPTMVRVEVSWNQADFPTGPNVSATLTINGTLFHEMNDDPLTLDASDGPGSFDRTLNFWANVSASVAHCTVEIDPDDLVDETNEGNNTLTFDEPFECRSDVTIAYTRINYLSEGKSDASMVGPGSGELFVRAIYPMPDINYLEWPSLRVKHSVDNPTGTSDDDASKLLGRMKLVRSTRNALSAV